MPRRARRYVRDPETLSRISGCAMPGWRSYAVYTPGARDEDAPYPEPSAPYCPDDEPEIDNSDCAADFEAVPEGYEGIRDYMRGEVELFQTAPGSQFPESVGLFSADGRYRMQSARGATYYPGSGGRAKCLAIPQCKMMNSTVMDGDWVRHPVYVLRRKWDGRRDRRRPAFRELGESWLSRSGGRRGRKSDEAGFASRGYEVTGTHLPFDVWLFCGAVMGIALRAWWGVAGMRMDRMPSLLYVTVEGVFEAVNPGCSWAKLSPASRAWWRREVDAQMRAMNDCALGYDLPAKGGGGRRAYVMDSILRSTRVDLRAEGPEEAACEEAFGEPWMPEGYKVDLARSGIFQFMWRRGAHTPSAVLVRRYDVDCPAIYGVRGWRRCLQTCLVAWLVSYRSYCKRRMDFPTCALGFDRRVLRAAMRGGHYREATLTDAEVSRLLRWYTPEGVAEGGGRRPSHIASYTALGGHAFSWELHRSLEGEPLVLKARRGKGRGRNALPEEVGAELPEKAKFEADRQRRINEENSRHHVYAGRRRISTSEAVVYGYETGPDGRPVVLADVNGRSYSDRRGVQAMGREDRLRIRIDGGAVAEVDYQSLHPNMLYALNGKSPGGGDVYDVGRSWRRGSGLDGKEARKAVKMMMVRMINARSPVVARMSFKSAWNQRRKAPKGAWIPWLMDLYRAVERAHAPIAHEFGAGRGVSLMNADGEIMRSVCLRLTSAGICALAVHDSVVVRREHAALAARVMEEEYAARMGGASIKVK